MSDRKSWHCKMRAQKYWIILFELKLYDDKTRNRLSKFFHVEIFKGKTKIPCSDVVKFVLEVCRVGGPVCVKLGANSTGYC